MVFWAKLFTCEMTKDKPRRNICKLLQFKDVTFNKLVRDFSTQISRIYKQKPYTVSYFTYLRAAANKTLALDPEDLKSAEPIVMTFFAVRNWIRNIDFTFGDQKAFRTALSVVVKRHGEIKTCKSLKLDYKR